jgi:hypothetical protein
VSRSHKASLPMTIPTREEQGHKLVTALCVVCFTRRALASGLCGKCSDEALNEHVGYRREETSH